MKTKQIELILIGLAGVLSISYGALYITDASVGLLITMRYALLVALGLYVAYVFITQQRDKKTVSDLRDEVDALNSTVNDREKTIDSQKKELAELNANLDKAEKKAAKLESDFKKAKKEWEAEKKTLEAKKSEE